MSDKTNSLQMTILALNRELAKSTTLKRLNVKRLNKCKKCAKCKSGSKQSTIEELKEYEMIANSIEVITVDNICLALAIAFLFNVHFVTNVQY